MIETLIFLTSVIGFILFAYSWVPKVDGVDYPQAADINDLQTWKMDRDNGFHDVGLYASFSAAIDAIGATETTLLISTEQAVSADKTVPANVTLLFTQGGSLNIATTKTVTINGHIEAGLYQIFKWTGTGKVVLSTGTVKEIYPQWWEAKGDGVTNDTAAIEASIVALPSNGGKIIFSAGTFLFNDIILPAYPKIININGMGIGATIFQPYSVNTRLFRAANHVRFNKIGNFSIKAHASGSTGEAISLKGMNSTCWHDIQFISNASGNFTKGFLFNAGEVCYRNVLNHIVVHCQSGPIILVSFENEGTYATNANSNYLKNFWVYANTGITKIIDALRSTLTVIEDSLFEDNPSASAVIPGQNTLIRTNWFELNNKNIEPKSEGTGATSVGVTMHNNWISDGTIILPVGCDDWYAFDNRGGGADFEDSGNFNLLQVGSRFRAGGGSTGIFLPALNAVIHPDYLLASQVTFYLDEANNKLHFRVKYANGTTWKTGEVALT